MQPIFFILQGAFYVLIDLSSTGIDSDTLTDRRLSGQQMAPVPGVTSGVITGKDVRVSMAADDHVVIEGFKSACTFIKENS